MRRFFNTAGPTIPADHYLKDRQVRDWHMGEGLTLPPHTQVFALLAYWADTCPRPTILLLDEGDALVGDTLISLLRQIRAGYAQRPEAFPQSIILCGVRDVRDYRLHQGDGEVITGGSAFNIKSTSLRMGNFTEQESHSLWLQHTEETGQGFDPVIFPELWEDTHGQPWLVNALARELTWELRHNRDRNRLVPLADYWQARENLILSRAIHLDQLADKLKEPRVRAVVSALLSGSGARGLITRKPLHSSSCKPSCNGSSTVVAALLANTVWAANALT